MKKFFPIFTLLFFLCACTVVDVEDVPLQDPPAVPAQARPAPVGFNKIRYAIPTGATTMGISMRSLHCPWIMKKVQAGLSGRSFVNDTYKQIFQDTMEGLGYDITGDPGRMFDEFEDMQRTAYAVGARVVDIKMDVCNEESFWFGYDKGTVGEAMVAIEWTVYDMMHRKNVYKTTTKGSANLPVPNDEGIQLLLENAFAAAAHNLGADPVFHDLVFLGREPENQPDTYEDPYESPLPLFDPQDSVTLDPPPLSRGKPDFKSIGKAAVLIQTAGAHGSGFFITREGHILTNAHVVGHATRVRIVTAGKKEALAAEVLRVDRLRDVALLRLEDMPANLAIPLLPVRLEKPAVSENVYAIGSPSSTRLQDTVTKGIVSAHRYDRREKQWYIQADVFVYGGNSGRPLVDAHGNLIGLSVAAYNDGDQALTGLNLFVPIADALDALAIDIQDKAGLAETPPLSLKAETK